MDRIPPHNEEAERSALGACMLSKEALMDVAEEVKEKLDIIPVKKVTDVLGRVLNH